MNTAKAILCFIFSICYVTGAWAADCSRLLALSEIGVLQQGHRHGEEYIKRLQLYVKKYGRLPGPLKLVEFEDGRIFVHDGHHQFTSLKREGFETLREGVDFELSKFLYSDYTDINFSAGWVTPFDPRKSLRVAELGGFKSFVQALRKVQPDVEVESFIRAHPEAFSLSLSDSGQLSPDFEGSARDRIAYFKEMDRSMPMKIGHLLGAFPRKGILWEPGTGSGGQAAGYAAFYPELLVVGTDLDYQSIRHAQSNYALGNLVYMHGDAMSPDFPSSFIDAVEDSSMGHHLVSYGKSGSDFNEQNIEIYRRQVARVLKPGGYYAMRDFVAPDWPSTVRVYLSTEPGQKSGYGALSKAELFEDFIKNFRSHDYPEGAEVVRGQTSAGMQSFEAPGEFVANFMLRLQYTDNWEAEMREQYTYYTQQEHLDSLTRLDFRVDFAQPFHNPWIEANWWQPETVHVQTLQGEVLDLPPTNLILYARKLRDFEVKSLQVTRVEPVDMSNSWMKLRRFKNNDSNSEYDLIAVPGLTKTFIPFETTRDGNFIFLNTDVERPALEYYRMLTQLDSTTYSGVNTEGFSKVFPDPNVSVQDAFAQVLEQKALTTFDEQSRRSVQFNKAAEFFPSPGTSDELVGTYFVDMGDHGSSNVFAEGQAKRVEINQFIASANLGAIPDGRLQVAAYQLSIDQKWPIAAWFGETFEPVNQSVMAVDLSPSYATVVSKKDRRISWREASVDSEGGYLSFEKVFYDRVLQSGKTEEQSFEFARPSKFSVNTVSALPYFVSGGELYVGFESYSLPSFQARGFDSVQAVVPAFRLPNKVQDRIGLRLETERRLVEQFQIKGSLKGLGEGYFSSPGQTPEKIFPYAIEVNALEVAQGIRFVAWSDLKSELKSVKDLHTLVSIYRLVHALGKL
jgi:SAM-dependent methyltransferase